MNCSNSIQFDIDIVLVLKIKAESLQISCINESTTMLCAR